jgi:hypothetical protein
MQGKKKKKVYNVESRNEGITEKWWTKHYLDGGLKMVTIYLNPLLLIDCTGAKFGPLLSLFNTLSVEAV